MNGDDEDFTSWLGGDLGYSDEDMAAILGDNQPGGEIGYWDEEIAAMLGEDEPSAGAAPGAEPPTNKPKRGRGRGRSSAKRPTFDVSPRQGKYGMIWWGYDDIGRFVPFGKHSGGAFNQVGRFIPNTSPEYYMQPF